MKTDIPGRGTGRCRIPPGGVGEFGHIFLRLKDIFTESEAIDAVGDETHGGHASLGTVESALEGRVRSGGAGGGESHWARGHENKVVGMNGHGSRCCTGCACGGM